MESAVVYNPTFKRGYWRDTWTLLHWPRAMCFYAFMVIGVFLSPHIQLLPTILAFIAMFFALQVAAYALDEIRGRHVSTDFTDKQLYLRSILGLSIAIGTGTYLATTISWTFLPLLAIGTIFIVLYNFEVLGSTHTRIFFGLIWGAYPLLTMYYFETLQLPSISAWIMAGAGISFSFLHISTYGNWRCRVTKCVDLKDANSRGLPYYDKLCHGQTCEVRRTQISGATHHLNKQLANVQVIFLWTVTLAIIAMHYSI